MADIFLQLTQFRFKRETLEDIAGAAANKNVAQAIEGFYAGGKKEHVDYANILITLMKLIAAKEGKQKLLIALVYFIVNLNQAVALDCLNKVLALNENVILKVKFFSYVFKSSNNNNLKKWILKQTVTLIENEEKIASFAGLVEHFDELVNTLNLTEEQTLEIYFRLICYLEKHPVYKKLCSIYVIKSLQKVTDKTAQNKETTQLVIKAIRSGVVSDSALTLLSHSSLNKNELYPVLQVLLTGDYEKLDSNTIKNLEGHGLVGQDVLRKMKVESIPRLLSTVKVASYDQVAERLSIKKSEVQAYIIDAIKQGIIKAKLDQFQETVIINRVNFRALRQEERAKLQKDITDLCSNLSQGINAH